MKHFLDKFSNKIKGTISGFNRIVIKDIFKNLNYAEGMFAFLLPRKVLLKDFGEYVQDKAKEFLEPFLGYSLYENREEKRLELVKRERKCLHLYYYWQNEEFGFSGAHIQTWFPYTCTIYLIIEENGFLIVTALCY